MTEENTSVQTEHEQETQSPDSRQQAFQNAIWGESPSAQATTTTQEETRKGNEENAAQQQASTTTQEQEEILEPTEWLKREFDIEDPNVLKQQINEYKELKAKPQEEQKFTDETSKQIYELLREGGEKKKEVVRILKEQEYIEELVGLEVNKDNAADIIKLQMKLKNKQLSPQEIDFEYKQNYELPKEPVQKATEEDDDFNERHEEWKERCVNIETRRVIAAKLAQPELSNLKSELVLPEINKGQQDVPVPSPEDLAAFEQTKNSFIQSAKQTIDGFNGFNVQVKDKDVDFSVNYTPSTDERKLLSDTLTKLADAGFDANEIFANRWYDIENKTFKIDQMTEDLSRILIGKNSDQKLAMDAANKRMDAFLAEKKNVSVSEGNRNSTFQPNAEQSSSEKLASAFFG